jgi:phage repressor protein C with HTH and peptisase S24 domain
MLMATTVQNAQHKSSAKCTDRAVRMSDMTSTPGDRLTSARKSKGYTTQIAGAEAIGANRHTYAQHENGTRPISRSAAIRYARFFGLTVDYLLTGRQVARSAVPSGQVELPVMGKVGAGAIVDMPDDPAGALAIDSLSMNLADVFVLEVSGNSQYPVLNEGDRLLVQARASSPDQVINRMAVVQVETDGRRLVKIVRRGLKSGTYRLWSNNAPEEEGVRLLAAWQIIGVIYARQ